MDVHAGVGETSAILAIRPDLVRSDYKTPPDRAGRTLDELQEIDRGMAKHPIVSVVTSNAYLQLLPGQISSDRLPSVL